MDILYEIYIQSRREELHLIFCPIAENYWFTISCGGQEIAYMVRFAPNMMKMLYHYISLLTVFLEPES